ncbi:MAG: potassium-transporting ATPase subunit KdpA, partial [Tumebacillaceae bacterium]
MSMGLLQVAITLVIILLLVKPVGSYLVKVFDYEKTGLDRVFGPVERLIYRLIGVREGEGMGWKKYVLAMLLSNLVMMLLMY